MFWLKQGVGKGSVQEKGSEMEKKGPSNNREDGGEADMLVHYGESEANFRESDLQNL